MNNPRQWERHLPGTWGGCVGRPARLGIISEKQERVDHLSGMTNHAVFSIGEAFYSPRVYEYAAAIAPPGQEASYSSLAYLPFLVGKLLVGAGGWLLAAFCPEHGPRRSGTMWLIFALAASIAPIGLIVLRPYIRVREAGREQTT